MHIQRLSTAPIRNEGYAVPGLTASVHPAPMQQAVSFKHEFVRLIMLYACQLASCSLL